MYDQKEISIDDKQIFNSYLKKHNTSISELSFTNFFMWRDCYKFTFWETGELLCLIAANADGAPFAFEPIGQYSKTAFERAIDSIKEYFKQKGWKLLFKRVEENKLDYFKNYLKQIDIIADRDNSDYLYHSSDLIELKGKKFHGKKNHLNSFKKNYQFEYVKLSSDLVSECIRINNEWCERRGCEGTLEHGSQKCNHLYCEQLANIQALNNFEILGCKGALVKVNGRYEAFTVGEQLNHDTAVIHIEKANEHIRGLYGFVNQQFCQNNWGNTTYINREQDLGMEGLRKAKLSYNPIRLINKYIVVECM